MNKLNGQARGGHFAMKPETKKYLRSIMDQPVNIQEVLSGHYFAEQLIDCLNKKQSFGLRSAHTLDSILVFNVSKLVLYDYSLGQLNFIHCTSYVRMLNYIRLSLESHRIFLNAEESVQFLKNKGLIPET